MGNKLKIIIIGFIVLLMASLAINLLTFKEKEQLSNQRNILEKEKAALTQNLEKSIENVRGLEAQISSLNDTISKAQRDRQVLEKEKAGLVQSVNDLKRQQQDLQQQITQKQQAINTLNQQLEKERGDKQQIVQGLEAVKKENTSLKDQMKSVADQNATLNGELSDLQQQNSKLSSRLADMERYLNTVYSSGSVGGPQEKAPKPQPVVSLKKDAVELPPIVVRPTTGTVEKTVQPQQKAPEKVAETVGSVTAVNRENNFVIIDLGEESGIKVGDVFKVFRQNTEIGSVETIQTRKGLAACDIKRETIPLKAGDTVKLVRY
jgi:septal ring factor EnvC (AmiA/AmiB activator)